MVDLGFQTIVEEVLEHARVANRHQRMAMIELAFLQEEFGEGFVLSKEIIQAHARFPQREKNFLRVVQELLRGGHIVCDHANLAMTSVTPVCTLADLTDR